MLSGHKAESGKHRGIRGLLGRKTLRPKNCVWLWIVQMRVVDCADGCGGLCRWVWWIVQMGVVDCADGCGGLCRWLW